MFSEKGMDMRGCFLVGWRSRIGGSVSETKGRDEGSEVGDGVGALLG